MNPDFPQNERAKLEAKLTALLLGELHANEVAELSKAMEKDPELAALYERLKFTVELVREGAANPAGQAGGQAAPLKLSSERREKLLASFKTVAPKEFAKPRRMPARLVEWAAVAVIAGFMGALALPNFIKTRETARKNAIINNVRLLDGAKQQWALENGKSGDAEPTMEELGPYIGRGGSAVSLGSVAGETYVPGKVSELSKVETSVSQAKKLFGAEVAARGESRNEKVVVSPLSDGLEVGGEVGGGFTISDAQLNRLRAASQMAGNAPQAQVASAPAATPGAATGAPLTGQLQPGVPAPTLAAAPPVAFVPIVLPPNETVNGPGLAVLGVNSFGPYQHVWSADVPGNVAAGGVDSGVRTFQPGFAGGDLYLTNGIAGQVRLENADPVQVDRVLKQFGDQGTKTPSTVANKMESGSFPGEVLAGNSGVTSEIPLHYAASRDISEALKKLGEQSNAVVSQNWVQMLDLDDSGKSKTNGISTGPTMMFYADANNGSTSYRTLSQLGTDSEKGKLGVNDRNVTNEVADSWKFPALGNGANVGFLGRLEPESTGLNGDFQTAMTKEDLGGLRYLGTNGVVASQPSVAIADSFVPSDRGVLALNGATHSAGIIQGENRKAEIVLPAATDSVLMNRENQMVDEPITGSATSLALSDSGGFGGGAGAVGRSGSLSSIPHVRLPVGGKQVELAAANRGETKAAIPSVNAKFADVTEETNRALGFDWYLGNKVTGNSTMTASGGTMPATAAPASIEKAKEPREESIQTSQLIQDGKLAYQMGKTDEAEAKMNEALARDPNNQAALYYKSLAEQSRIRKVVDERNVTSMDRMVQVEKGWSDDNAQKQLPVPQLAQSDSHSTNQPRSLRYITGVDTGAETQLALKNYLRSKGVDMDGAGKSVFFNDRQGTLTVRGTDEDMEKVQAALDELSAGKTGGANSSSKITEYAAAKDALDDAKKWRQIIAMKAGQESVDVSLPRARMVSIMDPAVPVAPDKLSLGEKLKKTLTGKVESTTRIQIDQERPDIAGIGTLGNAGGGYDPYFLQTEFETIRSDAVLKKVVDNLKLDGGDSSKTEAAIKQLRNNLDLSPVKNSKFIEIGAKSAKPEEAARIANAVALAYQDYRSEEYDELKKQGINSLKQQLAEQDQKIAMLQSNAAKLRGELRIPDSMANSSSVAPAISAEQLKELSSLRVSKEAEYNQQATLLEGLKKMDRVALRRALPIAYQDTELNTLKSELDLAEQNLIKLKSGNGSDHPKLQNAKEAVDDLNRKIDERVDGILIGLQAKVDSAKSFLDTIDQRLAAAQKVDLEQAKVYAELNAELNKRTVDSALPKPTVPPPTPQPEVLTSENSFSTFSLNVSDVSFKLAAASLEKGQMPEPASIRSEEFINAFDYRDPDARDGAAVAFASERARYPFAHNRELLRFSLKTAAAGRSTGRPLNIVLLLDNSGSMERADRVKIIQEALRVLAGQLQAADTFSIVTFARTAQLRVDGIPGNQAGAAAEEIAKLTPEGGTNLGDALELAYATALRHYLANGDNRVVLLTDGAANLGDVNPDVLKKKVEAHRQQGVALDCFGIGWEGYNDDLLEVLTRNGDGRYGFINTPEEATTEFVAQIAGALHVAASDVKVQVEFNPKRVTSYRQIGYAKHQLTKEQFRDNTVDAAEIAAQEAGNALYTTEIDPQGEGSIATVRVRYKVPGTAEYREQAWDVPYTGGAVALDQASPAMRLAATASAFSEWLATSPFAAEVSTDQLLKYLSGVPQVYGVDTRPAKLEWMIRQARSISGK